MVEAGLSAKFSIVDEMSTKLDAMASAGERMLTTWQSALATVNDTMSSTSASGSRAVSSIDGVATSAATFAQATATAQSASLQMDSTLNRVGNAATTTATSAASLSTSLHSVDQSAGLTAEELNRLQQAQERCQQAESELSSVTADSVSVHDRLQQALASVSSTLDFAGHSAFANSEATASLASAGMQATVAIRELEQAQENANATSARYEAVVNSGTATTEELELAAQNASDAAEQLANANVNASEATAQLAEAERAASEQTERYEESTTDAMSRIESAITSLGIAKCIEEIGDAFGYASEKAKELETSAGKVATIMDTSQASLDSIEKSVSDVSYELGISSSEINNSVYDAISATSDTANAVTTVGTASKLAIAGFAGTGDALSVLATIMNSYGMQATELIGISDSLVQTQNLGVTTVGQLAVQMGKAIATASSYSVDLYNLEASVQGISRGRCSVEGE